MNITYRKLTVDDLDVFIKMRIDQLREEGAKEDIDLEPALRDYYLRHLSDGTFVSWLALDKDRIIGTSGMSIVEKPPYFGCPSGKIGYSVRTRGIGGISHGESWICFCFCRRQNRACLCRYRHVRWYDRYKNHCARFRQRHLQGDLF